MMDRMVDLEEVIRAGKRGSGEAGKVGGEAGTLGSGSASPARERKPLDPAPAKDPSPPPRLSASPPSLEALRAAWPAIVAAVRGHSRFLGEAFAATEPVGLELPWINVSMREPNQLLAERLHQEAAKVEEILSRSVGQDVRLKLTAAPAEGVSLPKPQRLSDSNIKAERLREFRSKDPTLDTAADALDLEIVD
jgi:hypothetical protein